MASNVVATVMGNPVTLSQTIQGSSTSWIDSVTSNINDVLGALTSTIQGVYQVKNAIDNPVQSVTGKTVQAVSTSSLVPDWVFPSSTATTGQKTIAAIIWIMIIAGASFFVLKAVRRAR